MVSSAQPTRLSKLSFPRYTTSLATTPRVRPTLALHILRAAQGTQRFCPPHGEVCRASARHDASIDLLAAVHSSAQGPLSAPNWIAHRARIFLETPDALIRTNTAILTARDMATPNALLETTLTASTQLFAAPRRAPQFRIAQVRVRARPRAGRHHRGEESSSNWYCTKTRKTRCYLVEGGCGRAFAMSGTSSRRRVIADGLYDEGWMRVPFLRNDATIFIPVACFPIKQRSKTLPGPYPRAFATASCDRAQHKERGGPRRANPQKGHRVEQSSSRVKTLATSHPVERSGLMQEKQTGGHQEIRIASKRFVRDLGCERTMPRPCTGPARFPPDVQDINRTRLWYSISVPLRLGRAIPRRSGTAFLVTCRCTYPRGIRAVR
ncbi:hypothetical protein EDB86DRAFT_3240296 [Lactarius hatsudake]|nr:hypothetical protein EDB86DRAFT_3240296 [Lactarius hatsudake]